MAVRVVARARRGILSSWPALSRVNAAVAWPGVNQPLQCAQRASFSSLSAVTRAQHAVDGVASARHQRTSQHRQRASTAAPSLPSMRIAQLASSTTRNASGTNPGAQQSSTTILDPASSSAAAVQEVMESPPVSRKPLTPRRLLRAYSQLSKNKLSIFVTGTAALGFLTAGPPVSVPALLGVTLGTYLCSASAGTCNQIYEIRNDSVMNRTKTRPLPSGRLSPAHATAFAATTAIAGVSLLATACNPLTAALGAANIVLYAGVYTPMKQMSYLNTEVGAIVGAIPPLMGWAACTGSITADPAGIALFGALFLWQMPHFYALAWRHREDYARGGYQMISLGDHGGQRTANRTMAYSLGLVAFPLATTMAGVTGPMFIVEATIANAIFLYKARQFQQDPSDRNARGVFLNSLWYLPVIMVFLAFHSHRWKQATDEEEGRRLSVSMPVVDAPQNLSPASQTGDNGSADSRPLPQWLEEVDMSLAVAFADDPASKFVSNALSGAAAKARRILRAHCPHELLIALAPERRARAMSQSQSPAEAEASVSAAMVAAASEAACPVTHQSHASVLPRAVADSSDASNELATAIQASAVPSLSCPATTAPNGTGQNE